MTAIFAALVDLHTFAEVMLYLGLALSWAAAVQYARDARAQLASARAAPSSSG
jgi:hypothetical protein